MRKWVIPIGVVALVAAALLILGGRVRRDRFGNAPERFILIVIDSLRADHVGCYGSSKDLTPNIDAFAAGGVRFADAFSVAPHTFGSNSGLFTGRYPHEVRALRGMRLANEAVTLAECFAAQGYETAAFSSHFIISRQCNFNQGFKWLLQQDRQDDAMVERCRRWLARHRDDRYFVLLYLWDPHLPYRAKDLSPELQAKCAKVRASVAKGWPPLAPDIRRPKLTPNPSNDAECSPLEVEVLHELYDGAVRQADQRVGRVLEAIGAAPRTVVALLSDHGEEFLDHGGLRHKLTLYRELLHVPFIIRAPRETQRVTDTPVSNLDLMPTLLALAGIPQPGGVKGQPVFDDFGPRPVFAEAGYSLESEIYRYCVRLDAGALIYSVKDLPREPPIPAGGMWEYYDLRRDPRQQAPGTLESAPAHLRCLLTRYRADTARRLEPYLKQQPELPDRQTLEKLRTLGYVGD
ncbi:MAG: sulfatase [Armatimonadota bacterium]|nr:MAG: sulfatase [Armatimonadota bacterium]